MRIKEMQKIAFNIGYSCGLANSAKNKGLIDEEKQANKQFKEYSDQWENEKSKYVSKLGDKNCPVMRQLIKTLLEDRAKHFNLGLRQCSLDVQAGSFLQ